MCVHVISVLYNTLCVLYLHVCIIQPPPFCFNSLSLSLSFSLCVVVLELKSGLRGSNRLPFSPTARQLCREGTVYTVHDKIIIRTHVHIVHVYL